MAESEMRQKAAESGTDDSRKDQYLQEQRMLHEEIASINKNVVQIHD